MLLKSKLQLQQKINPSLVSPFLRLSVCTHKDVYTTRARKVELRRRVHRRRMRSETNGTNCDEFAAPLFASGSVGVSGRQPGVVLDTNVA